MSTPPDTLFFKSSVAAFEYGCSYLDNSIAGERPVMAFVLAVKGRDCIVKIANESDPQIPQGSIDDILKCIDFHTVTMAKLVDAVPNVKKGDLVMGAVPAEMSMPEKRAMAFIILEKIKPIYVISEGGWQRFPMEH